MTRRARGAALGSPSPITHHPPPPAPALTASPAQRARGAGDLQERSAELSPAVGRERPGVPAGLPPGHPAAEGCFGPQAAPCPVPVPVPVPSPLTGQRRHLSAALHATSGRGAPAKGSAAAPPQRSAGKRGPGGEFRRQAAAPRQRDQKTISNIPGGRGCPGAAAGLGGKSPRRS